MNHRLQFRLEDGVISLHGVWCPGDHGGHCDMPVVDTGKHEEECATQTDPEADCDCAGYAIMDGTCWAKDQLDLFVTNGDGWRDCIDGAIDLPWVAVTIDSCGPDGDDPVTVHVIAEVANHPEPQA